MIRGEREIVHDRHIGIIRDRRMEIEMLVEQALNIDDLLIEIRPVGDQPHGDQQIFPDTRRVERHTDE